MMLNKKYPKKIEVKVNDIKMYRFIIDDINILYNKDFYISNNFVIKDRFGLFTYSLKYRIILSFLFNNDENNPKERQLTTYQYTPLDEYINDVYKSFEGQSVYRCEMYVIFYDPKIPSPLFCMLNIFLIYIFIPFIIIYIICQI